MDRFISSFKFLIFTIPGCEYVKSPFKYSPEDDMKIDYMEDIIKYKEKYASLYSDFILAALNGVVTNRLETFINNTKESGKTGIIKKFIDNGDKYILLQTIIETRGLEELEKEYIGYIESYLRYSRLGDNRAKDFDLSPELKDMDPINKVRDYMESENIKVNELILPKRCEAVDYTIYPMKIRYSYIIKGLIKESHFKKEVVQDFYMGYDWSDGIENGRDVIEYIKTIL